MQASLFQCCFLLSDWLKQANVISRSFYSNMCASVHPRMCMCVKERDRQQETQDWLTLNWSQAGSCAIESPVLLLELGSLAPSAQIFYSIKTCISFETRQNQKNRMLLWANSLAVSGLAINKPQHFWSLTWLLNSCCRWESSGCKLNSTRRNLCKTNLRKKKKQRLKKSHSTINISVASIISRASLF